MPQPLIEDGLKAAIFMRGTSLWGEDDQWQPSIKDLYTQGGSATTINKCSIQARYSNVVLWEILPKHIETLTSDIKYGYSSAILSSTPFADPEVPFIFEIKDKIEKLQKYYGIGDPLLLNDFLQKNYSIIDILLEAPGIIKQVFGENIKLSLEVNDYEDDEMEELLINILSPYNPKDAIVLQNQLDDLWALNVYKKTDGKVVTVVNVI